MDQKLIEIHITEYQMLSRTMIAEVKFDIL